MKKKASEDKKAADLEAQWLDKKKRYERTNMVPGLMGNGKNEISSPGKIKKCEHQKRLSTCLECQDFQEAQKLT